MITDKDFLRASCYKIYIRLKLTDVTKFGYLCHLKLVKCTNLCSALKAQLKELVKNTGSFIIIIQVFLEVVYKLK